MEKVKSGDKVAIKASTWNAFIETADWASQMRRNQSGKGLSSGLGFGIVPVRNDADTAFGRFSAMVLSGICVKPGENEDEFVSCPSVFTGAPMTGDREGEPYAILLEPLEPGAIGRAMLLGVTPAEVTILDAEHCYAVPAPDSGSGELESSETGTARILWKAGDYGNQWCLLELGGAGGGSSGEKAYMCKVASGSAQDGFEVFVYPDGKAASGSAYQAILYVPDLALDSELPYGTWLIGHKCALEATGGSET